MDQHHPTWFLGSLERRPPVRLFACARPQCRDSSKPREIHGVDGWMLRCGPPSSAGMEPRQQAMRGPGGAFKTAGKGSPSTDAQRASPAGDRAARRRPQSWAWERARMAPTIAWTGCHRQRTGGRRFLTGGGALETTNRSSLQVLKLYQGIPTNTVRYGTAQHMLGCLIRHRRTTAVPLTVRPPEAHGPPPLHCSQPASSSSSSCRNRRHSQRPFAHCRPLPNAATA